MEGETGMQDAGPRYERPALSLVEADVRPYGVSLFVGGMEAAGDLAALKAHNITTVVNCAVNLDLNYAAEPFPDCPDPAAIYGIGHVRYYKLGLVDGHGNPETMMLGSFFLLRGAFTQKLPERATYPRREQGNVLVNCRAGRSRSVILAALFLSAQMKDKFPTLDAAIDHVREKREIRPDEWFETPKPMLVAAARRALGWIEAIDAAQGADDGAPSIPVAG
jgi:hypothetical protein